jgi:hypothetical protein
MVPPEEHMRKEPTMPKGMLGSLSLRKVQGARNDLEEKLAGEHGKEWLRAFQRFLRKEDPWDGVGDLLIDLSVAPKIRKTVSGYGPRMVASAPLGNDCFQWNADAVSLFISEPQIQGLVLDGPTLAKEIEGKRTVPANILDALLENEHLIPRGWRGKKVFFWGSIFQTQLEGIVSRDERPRHAVLYLQWYEDRGNGYGPGWTWGDECIDPIDPYFGQSPPFGPESYVAVFNEGAEFDPIG